LLAGTSFIMRPAYWISFLLLLSVPAIIWLACRPSTPSLASTLEGRATDGQAPLAGAQVRFRGDAVFAVTDKQGRFSLARSRHGSNRLLVAREGYFIRGFDGGRLPPNFELSPLPSEDQDDYSWVEPGPRPSGPNNCVNCHKEIYREWAASAHARSATNPHLRNLMDGTDWHGHKGVGWNLRGDNENGTSVCTACHAPTVSAGDPAFANLAKVEGVQKRGVHCDYCHKIAGATVDERGLTFGRFGYRLLRPARGQFFFGPLDDAERAGESFSYSPLYRDSRYCASCHEGVVFGVPVYTTYSEWLASPARREGQQCQSCHMTPTGTFTNIAPGKGGIERDPLSLASHRFPGGEKAMLRRCLNVSVRLTARDGQLRTRVEVRAEGVGHRVPTGFIDRNLLLIVEAFDRTRKPVPLHSGPTLPELAGKTLAGKPGRLYAKQLMDSKQPGPIPFWRHHGTLRDTRLFPGRPDKTEFVFPARAERVRVRLIYRRFWHTVAKDKSWPDNEILLRSRLYQSPRRLVH
jgi:hypothetical protein